MPPASILEIERPPAGHPRRSSSRRSGTSRSEPAAIQPKPASGSGRLCLIERCGGGPGLTSAERDALVGADIIVYERSLAPLLAAILPIGAYAEPALEPARGAGPGKMGPVFERCLKFALDGWSVVQLMERRPAAEQARWIEDATVQLMSAGVSNDTPVQVLVDAACGGPAKIGTPLRSVRAVVDHRGIPGGLMMVVGPIAIGPAPQVYAFAANGLAG